MSRGGRFLLCAMTLVPCLAWGEDVSAWLQRMNQASRTLSYTGIFVYESRGSGETSRIVHLVDASGEHERLETLDGPAREVVRHNDEVNCYLPADHLVVKDRLVQGRHPGLLIANPASLGEIYNIRLGEPGRIAGRDARLIVFEPRDDMRYARQLWVDASTGLLLKARMLTDSGSVLEEFSFTDVTIGPAVERQKLSPHRAAFPPDWRVVNARGVELRKDEIDWNFRKLPPGFKPVSLVRRGVKKGDTGVIHAAFSDGLASVSVFIEGANTPAGVSAGSMASGPTGIFRRTVNDRIVTVLGEVPMIALKRIAEGVEPRSSK